MLGFLGFLTMALIIILLLKNKTVPAIAFITVPTLIALIAGFSVVEVGGFIKTGVVDTAEMATLFIFSITFFGLMGDVGMFDRIISALVKKAGNGVMSVCFLTTLIAMIGHLDGSGASTFLITIPAMLPIFKKLGMRKTSLMTICTAAMGVMNLLPWGGPTMRAASVINVDAAELWHQMIPMQVVGVFCAFGVAAIIGMMEKKRGAGYNPARIVDVVPDTGDASSESKEALMRPKLFWFNVGLTLAVILVLSFVKIPAFLPFMVGTAIALFVNYPGTKAQEGRIKAHSRAAIMMASTLLSAGVLLGILQESGIMDAMASVLVSVIPTAMGPYIAIVIGVLSAPLALVFCTDSYYYGVMPIVLGVASSFGVSPVHVAITMIVCRNCACFISPVVPATFLGCGLAEVDIKDHIKSSFGWVWAISIIMLVTGLPFGIITLGV